MAVKTPKQPKPTLTTNTFTEQLDELRTLPVEVKIIRGNPSIEQTTRNQIRRKLLEGLYATMKELLETHTKVNGVYYTEQGVSIEIENQSVVESNVNESGMMTISLNLSMENLSYDALENLIDDSELMED